MPEKVLIVDDDFDTLRLVGLMLQREGYEIVAASSGLQALSLAQGDRPDLVLLDVMIPDMDGYEVARRLRAAPATADVPIIMFTAKSQVEDKLQGFEAGIDDYLTKPTQPRELIAHMKAVLARANKNRVPSVPRRERGLLIGILAARGGLGVSTLALNLGLALSDKFQKDMIVSDFRPGQGTIGLDLGYLKNEGLNRLLARKPTEITAREIENELIQHPSGTRLLLSSHQPGDARFEASVAGFDAITRHLPSLAGCTVLDLGPSLTPVNEKVVTQCDELILVTEPDANTVMMTRALSEDLVNCGVGHGRTHMVQVNRFPSGLQLSVTQVQEQLGRPVAALITPAPELAQQAAQRGIAMIHLQPESLTAQQFRKLAEKIAQRSP